MTLVLAAASSVLLDAVSSGRQISGFIGRLSASCSFFFTRLLYFSLQDNRVSYFQLSNATLEWFGSRVVSVLDSGAEGPGFKSQP